MKKKEKKYILLELVEERPMALSETMNFLEDYTSDFESEETTVKIEWFPGTRFFRAPALLYFSMEAIMEEEDDPDVEADYWKEPGEDCHGDNIEVKEWNSRIK